MDILNHIRTTLTNTITSFRNTNKPIIFYPAILVGTLGSLIFARAAWIDYKTYLSYGPGGPPYNVFGWLLSTTIVRALSINTLDLRKLEKDPDRRTWLGEDWERKQAPREGNRPKIGSHPIPQRQLDQFAPEGIKQKLLAAFDSIVAHNPNLVQLKPSQYERHHDAIFIGDSHPVTTKDVLGYDFPAEISHVHSTADYSVHVVLAPKDAVKVIKARWGQLHGFAGVEVAGRQVVPKAYVLLYAPRNDDELAVVMDIVRAAIAYMTNTEKERVNPA